MRAADLRDVCGCRTVEALFGVCDFWGEFAAVVVTVLKLMRAWNITATLAFSINWIGSVMGDLKYGKALDMGHASNCWISNRMLDTLQE